MQRRLIKNGELHGKAVGDSPEKVAGPRGFEPRVSGFGGLRTVLVGWFGALILSGLRAPFSLIQSLCIN